MAFRYPIQYENINDNHYEANPGWVVMFIRFAYPASFDRTRSPDGQFVSYSITPLQTNPVLERTPLIVQNDCISWETSTSKESHVSGANFVLVNSGIDYMQQISCGDYVLLWAHNNAGDTRRIIDTLQNNAGTGQANFFNDGLKFIGRVASIARKASKSSETGIRSVLYSVEASGFTELDSQIYYDDAIALKYTETQQFLTNVLGAGLDTLQDTQGFINAQTIMPLLVKTLLGLGTTDTNAKTLEGGVAVSPNRAYRIPNTLASILYGNTIPQPLNKVGFTYKDILKMVVGIQKYSADQSSIGDPTNPIDIVDGFFDTSWTESETNVFNTGYPLAAKWLYAAMNFNNTTTWSVLETYINRPIDEMYTCLRVFPGSGSGTGNQMGQIFPALVCRQVPFNTDIFVNQNLISATSFFELPRWVVDQTMVLQENFVKSDAQRFNFLSILGTDTTGQNVPANDVELKISIPPICDSADIQRHGLKALIRTLPVDSSFLGASGGTSKAHIPGGYWVDLVGDQLMDGSNFLVGTLSCKGIQEPIPEGDNLEYDGLLFHIERVVHTGSVDTGTGLRSFNTSLDLSHGLAVDQSASSTTATGVVYGTLEQYPSNSDPEQDVTSDILGDI